MDKPQDTKTPVAHGLEPAPPAYEEPVSPIVPDAQLHQQQPQSSQQNQAYQQPNLESQHGIQPAPNQGSYAEPTKPEPARMEYRAQADPNDNHKPASSAMVVPLFRLGEAPAQVDCPFCKRVVTTHVEQHNSSMTIIAGVLLGLVCICLACIPCITHACNDRDHFCTSCGKQLTHQPHDGQVQVLAGQPGQHDGAVPSQYAAAPKA